MRNGQHRQTAGKVPIQRCFVGHFNPFSDARVKIAQLPAERRCKKDSKAPLIIAALYPLGLSVKVALRGQYILTAGPGTVRIH